MRAFATTPQASDASTRAASSLQRLNSTTTAAVFLKIDLDKTPIGSTSFFAECERIAAIEKHMEVVKAGTLGLLIRQYISHPAFTDLAQSTELNYNRCFNYLKIFRKSRW